MFNSTELEGIGGWGGGEWQVILPSNTSLLQSANSFCKKNASSLMVNKYKQGFSEQQLFVSSTRVVMSNICTAGSLSAEGARHRGCELNDNDEFRWTDLVFQKHNPSR